jgi:hypothetical protein
MNRGGWSAAGKRNLIRRNGASSSRGEPLAGARTTKKQLPPKISKRELKEQSAAALAAYAGEINRIPAARRGRR